MNENLARRTGSAMFWKGLQLAAEKIIFLCRTVILARLLTPDDFGLLAISMIAVDVLLNVTNFGMLPALVQRPEIDKEHYDSAWTINMLRALTVSLIVFLAAPFIAALFAEPRATQLIRVVAVRPVLQAAASIRIVDLMRDLRFRSLASLHVPEALVTAIVSIGLAPDFGVWALVAGALVGPTVLTLISYVIAPYRPRVSLDRAYAQPLIKFGQWVFLISLVAVMSSSAVQLAVARQLSAAELGLYFMAAKLAFIPYEVSTRVVSEVAFPLYAKLQSEPSQVGRAFRAILTAMSALLLPVCSFIIALAPALVDNVLGPDWAGTADLIRLLALVSLIDLVGDTFAPILKGMGRPGKLFVIEAVQASVLAGSMWGLISRFGVNGAALAWLPAVVLSQLIGVIFLRSILPKPFAGLGKPMAAVTALSALGAVVALVIKGSVPGLAGLVGASSAGAVLTYGLMWVFDRRFDLNLGEDLRRAFPQLASFARTLR